MSGFSEEQRRRGRRALPERNMTAVEGDDPEMLLAVAYARRTARVPVELLAEGAIEEFHVKAAIDDGGRVEHCWLSRCACAEGAFVGEIDNEPQFVTTVRPGQRWSVPEAEISDWMFVKDGRMWGNFTLRVMLDTVPGPQRAELQAALAPMPEFDRQIGLELG